MTTRSTRSSSRKSSAKLPGYLLHKPTGQARTRINGRDYYLGAFGSEQSRRKYGELIAKHASGQLLDPIVGGCGTTNKYGMSVAELLLAFKAHAESYYSKDGKRTAEVDCFYSAMRPVRELNGLFPAKEFGPLHLKAVRDQYIASGWTRYFCNRSTNRVRHIWRWAVSNGMVPVETLQALEAVGPLKAGKCAAPDRKRREAVPENHINKVRSLLSGMNRDFFDLLRVTGARPSEILGLSMSQIDRTSDIWVAQLSSHKTDHHGKSRKLFFGPKSQLILRRCPTTGPIFTIRRDSFSAVVKRACIAAGIPPFVPYALRHTKATELRDSMSIEVAQATLGHAQPLMTARYSSKMDRLAIEAAKACG